MEKLVLLNEVDLDQILKRAVFKPLVSFENRPAEADKARA